MKYNSAMNAFVEDMVFDFSGKRILSPDGKIIIADKDSLILGGVGDLDVSPDYTEDTVQDLFMRFIPASYRDSWDYPSYDRRVKTDWYRLFSHQALLEEYSSETLKDDLHFPDRRFEFELYLYRRLLSGITWKGLSWKRDMCKIKFKSFYLILKKGVLGL